MILCDLGIWQLVKASGLFYQNALLMKPLEISARDTLTG
jgi:hypothetical protein